MREESAFRKSNPGGIPPSSRRSSVSIPALAVLYLYQCIRGHAEDQVGYRFEKYQEDSGRIGVETDSLLFDLQPKRWLSISGEAVYDAISGFTPTGSPPPNTITFVQTPPPPGSASASVPLSHMKDKRYSASVDATATYGHQHFTPEISFSEESDYISKGAALNYSIDLNDKNTTLNGGWSHDWDRVLPHGFLFSTQRKNSEEFFVGVNQLVNPKAYFTANLTYGHASGYLNDQYRGVLFDNEPQGDPTTPSLEPENRPRTKQKYIGYISYTQAITPVHASVEASYRLFHDSFDITANTIEVAWYQKFGKQLVISPTFRYYRQNAASFYGTRFPDFNTAPTYYSADYRLSEMESFALGISVNWKIYDRISFDATYKRYVMRGLDGVTSQTAYPSANVFTVGLRVWF